MKIQLSEHFDYKKLLTFTAPTIIMMLFNSIYWVVDGFFVSNYVWKDAFTAVNLTFPVIMVIASIGFMVWNWWSALISKTLWEKNLQLARKYFSMLVYFLVICGIILSILWFIFVEPIMSMLKASWDVLADCIVYWRVLFLSLVFFMLQEVFQSFFIVNERPDLWLKVAVVVWVSNMILDYLLMYVFKMWILWAALATAVAQFLGAVIPLIYFMVNKNSKLKFVKTWLESKPIIRSCINGSSEMLTTFSMSLLNILFNYQLIKFFGNEWVIAYGIIMYVWFIFTGMYLWYSFWVTPIIWYNYWAKNHEELKNVFFRSLKILWVAAIVLTLTAEIFSWLLAKIFVNYDPELLAFTTRAIRLYAIWYTVQWINIFWSAFFTGLNNWVVSATISFLRMFLFQIIMIFSIPYLFGSEWIWLATTCAEILGVIVTISFLVWKRKKYNYA
jgi:Na+-driven multidrug efflux pump